MQKTSRGRIQRNAEEDFSSDLKEESGDECLTEREREFQITGPMH